MYVFFLLLVYGTECLFYEELTSHTARKESIFTLLYRDLEIRNEIFLLESCCLMSGRQLFSVAVGNPGL